MSLVQYYHCYIHSLKVTNSLKLLQQKALFYGPWFAKRRSLLLIQLNVNVWAYDQAH